MSVTIQAMQDFATSLPEVQFSNEGGLGNVVEVSDLGDDLGMSLLANQKYTTSSYSSNPTPSMSGGLQEVDIQGMDNIQPVNLDFSELPSSSIPSMSGPSISIQRETSYQPANSFGVDGAYANSQSSSGPSINLAPAMQRDPLKEAAEKSELINKLQRLEAKGFPVAKRFTMDNSLEEIKAEFTRLVDARNMEASIRFQRNMLIGMVNGMEWLNNKFDPFDLKLDGWSEGVHENIEDYDDVFEELYDKYKGKGQMPPEMKLVMQLAGSGFMCHVTNSFFRSKMPTADDIFKNNPDLARQFAAAAAQQASPGFGNFMGMAMGVPPQGAPQRAPPQPQGVPMNMASGPGAFFNSPQVPQHMAAAPPPVQTARREMSGPSGVDDILRTFEEVRMAEEQTTPNFPARPPVASTNPAMAAAEEIRSLHSEDMGSIATERTARGGRRRRQAPVGNTVSLNV